MEKMLKEWNEWSGNLPIELTQYQERLVEKLSDAEIVKIAATWDDQLKSVRSNVITGLKVNSPELEVIEADIELKDVARLIDKTVAVGNVISNTKTFVSDRLSSENVINITKNALARKEKTALEILYREIFNREPDIKGITWWNKTYAKMKASGDFEALLKVVEAFYTSDEANKMRDE